ncbi:glycosyltransferase family 4 protein [Rhodoferax sp. U2-2l]|uniref:glycosyltransferase family 4 protein n=1 Tax=Rhodoferax sp. U2-2l TaxID=2884000 RepID=UPI001D09AD1D|nr:glycosyltransferase family 4 protein [Rhodoferax sp. U2-2l]MCB8747114.1 glycosyltransferase family 4 protein [Rhodoferax sp. U2-2l]
MEQSKIAVLICSNVIGGHEYQSGELVRDLMQFADVTVYVNRDEHQPIFLELGAKVISLPQQLLQPGKLPSYVWNGLRKRHELRKIIRGYNQIVVCAGAVEAGIAVSIALRGTAHLSMYLPFFFDRILIWGKVGHLYNAVLARFCRLYDQIITINRIQAKVIKNMTGVKTVIIPNVIRPVPVAPVLRNGKLLFIGRLDSQKRVDELLRWIDFPSNPFKEIIVIGDGPQRAIIEEVAATMKHVKVTFLGWLAAKEQDRVIDGNDVLILNSLLEGEPLVIRESNLRGIRVIARDIIGVRGVTHRQQRFDSVNGLQEILKTLKLTRGHCPSFCSDKSTQASRFSSIEALVYRIHG